MNRTDSVGDAIEIEELSELSEAWTVGQPDLHLVPWRDGKTQRDHEVYGWGCEDSAESVDSGWDGLSDEGLIPRAAKNNRGSSPVNIP